MGLTLDNVALQPIRVLERHGDSMISRLVPPPAADVCDS